MNRQIVFVDRSKKIVTIALSALVGRDAKAQVENGNEQLKEQFGQQQFTTEQPTLITVNMETFEMKVYYDSKISIDSAFGGKDCYMIRSAQAKGKDIILVHDAKLNVEQQTANAVGNALGVLFGKGDWDCTTMGGAKKTRTMVSMLQKQPDNQWSWTAAKHLREIGCDRSGKYYAVIDARGDLMTNQTFEQTRRLISGEIGFVEGRKVQNVNENTQLFRSPFDGAYNFYTPLDNAKSGFNGVILADDSVLGQQGNGPVVPKPQQGKGEFNVMNYGDNGKKVATSREVPADKIEQMLGRGPYVDQLKESRAGK